MRPHASSGRPRRQCATIAMWTSLDIFSIGNTSVMIVPAQAGDPEPGWVTGSLG
jgi:hypothetical protein